MVTSNGKRPARLSPTILHSIEQVAGRMPRGTGNRAAQAVAELSRLFTKDRSSLTAAYLDDLAHAGAYLQYFLPVNLSKIQVLLDEMPEDWPEHGQGGPIRVLDVGSGPGTGALAVLDWFQQHRPDRVNDLSVVAVDASRDALTASSKSLGYL